MPDCKAAGADCIKVAASRTASIMKEPSGSQQGEAQRPGRVSPGCRAHMAVSTTSASSRSSALPHSSNQPYTRVMRSTVLLSPHTSPQVKLWKIPGHVRLARISDNQCNPYTSEPSFPKTLTYRDRSWRQSGGRVLGGEKLRSAWSASAKSWREVTKGSLATWDWSTITPSSLPLPSLSCAARSAS